MKGILKMLCISVLMCACQALPDYELPMGEDGSAVLISGAVYSNEGQPILDAYVVFSQIDENLSDDSLTKKDTVRTSEGGVFHYSTHFYGEKQLIKLVCSDYDQLYNPSVQFVSLEKKSNSYNADIQSYIYSGIEFHLEKK